MGAVGQCLMGAVKWPITLILRTVAERRHVLYVFLVGIDYNATYYADVIDVMSQRKYTLVIDVEWN